MNQEERLKRAVLIAQAIDTARRLTADNAPTGVQIHAIATLAKRIAPHTCGDKNHIDELVLLFLDVAEATETLRKAHTLPNTIEELEDFFKGLDSADH